jgi:ADP-ribose pyrophosphatase YjhB (NUDIX family)
MLNDKSLEILKTAASAENTPELQAYWQKRYEELYTKQLFALSPRTEDVVASQIPGDKPTTAFGELNLVTHLDVNNNFDEVRLQTTIESAIRLLDSLLDIIKFTPQAHQVVNQYRKIGLGISNFKDYLAIRKPTSELDEIDYIGNMVSSLCYRASESLAEEKGTCGNWDKIKTHLRAKSFEYWYNLDTGEIKNGLELSEEFDETSVIQSNYQIVPRRNSHLLLFPSELEWQIWSDRDETSPPTDLAPAPLIDPDSTGTSATNEVSNTSLNSSLNSILDIETNPDLPVSDTPNSIQVELPNEDALKPLDEPASAISAIHKTASEKLQIPVIQEDQPAKAQETDAPNSLHFDLRPIKPNGSGQEPVESAEQKLQPNSSEQPAKSDSESSSFKAETKTEAQFQVGELVQISSGQSKFQNQVFQVGEIFSSSDKAEYKLIGQDEVENQVWTETDLRAVDLFDILDKINLQPSLSSQSRRIWVHAILTHNHEIAVYQQNGANHLPGGELPWNESPEQGLIKILQNKFNLQAHIADDLGSSLELGASPEQSAIHLAFLVDAQEKEQAGLKFVKTTQLGDLPTHLQVLINKYNRRQIFHSNWSAKLESLQASHAKELARLQNSGDLPNQTLQQVQNKENLAHYPVVQTNTNSHFYPNQEQLQNNSNMSKYALKLEQLVQTNAFGDIAVTLQYDAQGPRMISLANHQLEPELKHLLETILSILNFMLTRRIAPSEIASLIEREPEDGLNLPINDLLRVVAASLKEAPSTVNNINPDILQDVVPAIQEIAKAAANSEQVEPQAPAVPHTPTQYDKNQNEAHTFNPFGRS